MKKRFNILTVTMVALVVFNIVCNLVYVSVACVDAVSQTYSHSREERIGVTDALENQQPVSLKLFPTDLVSSRHTVVNAKTGKEIPVDMGHVVAYVDKSEVPAWTYPAEVGLMLASAALWLATIWFFIKLVRNINRIEIFTWKNVSLLRRIGVLMLSAFAASYISGMISNYEAWSLVALDGYMIDWFHSFDTITLVIGFCSLISAEVFAMGLRHQEELDLTI
ncbi:MAG: DUF2975 domain-containing protein [Prevotella sp.]|nr:DUF2975 domain-containing protein [Prevotella sp.]